MENTRCRRRSRWLAFAGYAGLLFYLSSLSDAELPRISVSDKLLHALFYAGFGFIFVWAMDARGRGWRAWQAVVVACCAALLYGATDEIHQLFVKGRSFEVPDMLADAVGGCMGGWLYVLRPRR